MFFVKTQKKIIIFIVLPYLAFYHLIYNTPLKSKYILHFFFLKLNSARRNAYLEFLIASRNNVLA